VATNVDPTESILRLVSLGHKPLFLASTSEVYGKSPKVPLAEDDDLVLGPTNKTRWIYACTKALDEFIALAHHQRSGLPVVIARFFNVVGPRQIGRYGMVLPRFVDQALAGGPLEVYDDGTQVRCFGHVLDVVGGMITLMGCREAIGKTFNLGSDKPVTIRALAEAVVAHVDPKIPIRHIPYSAAYSVAFEDIRCRVPDLRRARETIGYRPRHSLEDISAEVVKWRRAQLAASK
jgi:UDP-glucose 4-epimerase